MEVETGIVDSSRLGMYFHWASFYRSRTLLAIYRIRFIFEHHVQTKKDAVKGEKENISGDLA